MSEDSCGHGLDGTIATTDGVASFGVWDGGGSALDGGTTGAVGVKGGSWREKTDNDAATTPRMRTSIKGVALGIGRPYRGLERFANVENHQNCANS
jgi:hypothetical protein